MSSLFPSIALLQSDAGQSLLGFVPLILIFAIFYFLVIMPSRKRQKALAATIEAMKKGDQIITTGGIFGEVISVGESTVIMKIADNVRIKVSKSAIGGMQGDPTVEIKS